MEVPFVAKQATAEKRQRRERGSINPDDIIKGAFELAEQVGIDNLSMPLLGKHLGVGVTSIYWYFRKKDDLLNAMTDRALKQYVFATPYVEAKDWRETLANHARTMRKTFLGNPILCDLILIRSALSPRAAKLGRARRGEGDRKPRRGRAVAGGRLRHLLRGVGACAGIGRAAAALRQEPVGRRGPGDFEETMVVDAETAPLLAQATAKGHRIGAADDINFDYGLECILDHAERLIETCEEARPPRPRRSDSGALIRRSRVDAVAPRWLDLDDDGAALATAGAHRGDADAAAATLQLVDQRGDHPRTRCRNGMAEAAAASGEVHQLLVEPVFAARRDRHRGEGLVDLPQRDVGRLQAGPVEHLADHLHGAESAVTRRDTGCRPGPHGGHLRQLLRGGVVTVDEGDRGRGVVGAAAVARGDGEALDLGMQHLQPGQLLDGGVATRDARRR